MRLKGLTLSCKSHNHFGFSIPVCPGTVRNIPDLSHRFPYSYLIPFHEDMLAGLPAKVAGLNRVAEGFYRHWLSLID